MGSHPSGSSTLDPNGALSPLRSFNAICDCMSVTSCDSENTTGSLAETEPPDTENGLGTFGRQEGSEGSSVNLTSRLSGGPDQNQKLENDMLMWWSHGGNSRKTRLVAERTVCGRVDGTGDDFDRAWPAGHKEFGSRN